MLYLTKYYYPNRHRLLGCFLYIVFGVYKNIHIIDEVILIIIMVDEKLVPKLRFRIIEMQFKSIFFTLTIFQ